VQWSDAMALLEYRRGHYAEVINQKYVVGNPPKLSTVMFIKALACWQLKDHWGAIVNWIEGYELILAGPKEGLAPEGTASLFPGMAEPNTLEGSWSDWAVARLLMREWDGLMAEADKSVERVPLSSENAGLLRALGEWYAIRGEWRQALQRCNSCLQCNQKEAWDHATMDYFDGAIASLEMGDESSYSHLREDASTRFDDTDNISIAERVLKVNLLRPLDGRDTARLQPFADLITRKVGSLSDIRKQTSPYDAWYSMLLGLLEYRRGNYNNAVEWAHRSLDTATSVVALPNAADHVISALSLHQLGNQSAARFELQQAENALHTGFDLEFDIWHWRDWVFMRLLLREANLLIEKEPVHASNPASQ